MNVRLRLSGVWTMSAALALLGSLGLSQPLAKAAQIYSDPADAMLEARGDTSTDLPPTSVSIHPDSFGNYQLTVGEWYGSGPDGPGAYGLTTIVMPFQLPNFGAVPNPFTSANFGVLLNPNTGDGNSTDIDLYGLTRIDASPTVQTTDWYSGANPDPSATLIQASFLTPSSVQGWTGAPNNFTDASGDTNLLGFLNTAYAGGSNAGDYVFLRLSYSSDTFATGQDNYNITMREAGQQGEWPVISLTTNSVLGDTNGNGTVQYPEDFNPILANWRETNDTFGTTLARTDGDLNLDGVINVSDFREWKDAWLMSGGSPAQVTEAFASLSAGVVPEPASLMLVLAGLALVGAGGRRRA